MTKKEISLSPEKEKHSKLENALNALEFLSYRFKQKLKRSFIQNKNKQIEEK
jgi:hypothetical protein